jgi:hypothetical protein
MIEYTNSVMLYIRPRENHMGAIECYLNGEVIVEAPKGDCDHTLIDEITASSPLTIEQFFAFSQEKQRALIAFRHDIARSLTDTYVAMANSVHTMSLNILKYRKDVFCGYSEDEYIGDILSTIPHEYRADLFPDRNSTIREFLTELQKSNAQEDAKRAALHRKIEAFFFLFYFGMQPQAVAARLEGAIRAARGESYPLCNGVVAYVESTEKEKKPRIAILFGNGKDYRRSPDGNWIPTPKLSYSSFLSPDRKRHDDERLANDIVKALQKEYPLLTCVNTIASVGSFHEQWGSDTLYIDGTSIEATLASSQDTWDSLLRKICAIVSGVIHQEMKD